MAASYEDLRRQSLTANFPREAHGLALLLYQGMAAWIKAWARFKPKQEFHRSTPPPKKNRFSSDSRLEIVRLLVTMALGS
jgi:hypothetical protein